MLSKINSILFLAFFFSACYQSIPIEKPILSEDKMIIILKDIHLAEALLSEITDRRAKDSTAIIYYNEIFRIHQVDTANFEQSMNAYFSNPAQLDSLYNKVSLKIGEEKEERKRENRD